MTATKKQEQLPRERHIDFTAEQVRATLEGWMTQTRRVVKGLPPGIKCVSAIPESDYQWRFTDFENHTLDLRCPYGRPAPPLDRGDRLWVREAIKCAWTTACGHGIFYLADNHFECFNTIDRNHAADGNPALDWIIERYRNDWRRQPTCSPIHMPRWASRITLEITDVRVERLHDISAADIKAEGISKEPGHDRLEFSFGWDALNKKRGYPWESNCWVWAITFKRLEDS